MRSAAQRRQSIGNLIRAGALRPRKYVSIEDSDRVDAVAFIPTLTAEERERGFAVRVLPGVGKAILKAKERWPGARFWFFSCPNPRCRDALLGRGREYLIRLPDAPPDAWACRACLPVEHVARRYHARSVARARAGATHRVQLR